MRQLSPIIQEKRYIDESVFPPQAKLGSNKKDQEKTYRSL